MVAFPFALTSGVYNAIDENYPESKVCGILPKYNHYMQNIIKLSVLVCFAMPMTLISIMYILIGVTLWKSQKKSKQPNENNLVRNRFKTMLDKYKLKKDKHANNKLNVHLNCENNNIAECNSDFQIKNIENSTAKTKIIQNSSKSTVLFDKKKNLTAHNFEHVSEGIKI